MPDVAAPLCPVAKECGGCPLIGVERQVELESKLSVVGRAILAAGFVPQALSFQAVGSDLGYRNRIRVQVRSDGGLGFFNAHKAANCAVLERDLKSVLEEARAIAHREPDTWRAFRWVEFLAPDADGCPAAYCVPTSTSNLEAQRIRAALATSSLKQLLVHVADDRRTAARVPRQRVLLADAVFALVPVGSFMQVNSVINRALVAHVVALATAAEARTFADVYSGSGNFSLPLLLSGLDGSGVELDRASIPALQTAAAEQGLDAERFEQGRAEDVVTRWATQNSRFDFVIADPPRAGLGSLAADLARIAHRDLVFCSCSSKNVARDLAALRCAGFRLLSTALFDMFPHTAHVEAVFHLRR